MILEYLFFIQVESFTNIYAAGVQQFFNGCRSDLTTAYVRCILLNAVKKKSSKLTNCDNPWGHFCDSTLVALVLKKISRENKTKSHSYAEL